MLFGVAGGMAEWMDLDPAIVRLVWALLILAGGVGLLLYIVAAIVVPEAPFGVTGPTAPGTRAPGDPSTGAQGPWPTPEARRPARRQGNGNAGIVIGLFLVVAGSWFLIDRYVDIDTSWFLPGALIVIGLVLVVGALGRRDSNTG
jgi:phage shock protein PspC (stress-responsive transcriptional regulator)